jgi:hypothetical protein
MTTPTPSGCTIDVRESDGVSEMAVVEPAVKIHIHLPPGKGYTALHVGANASNTGNQLLRQQSLSGDGLDGTYETLSPGRASVIAYSSQAHSGKPAWLLPICVAGLDPISGDKDHRQTVVSLAEDCALGQFGMTRIARTADAGLHWTDVTPSVIVEPTVRSSWELVSTDHATWLLHVPVSPAVRRLEVFTSADLGQQWQLRSPVEIPADLAYGGIVSTDTQRAWLLFNHGAPQYPQAPSAVGITTDAGTTWRIASIASQPCDPRGLLFVDALTGWATGTCAQRPMFMVTHDCGQSWSWVTLPIPADEQPRLASLPCDCQAANLVFANPLHGSFVLHRSLIPTEVPTNEDWTYTTADGGRSWTVVRSTP